MGIMAALNSSGISSSLGSLPYSCLNSSRMIFLVRTSYAAYSRISESDGKIMQMHIPFGYVPEEVSLGLGQTSQPSVHTSNP